MTYTREDYKRALEAIGYAIADQEPSHIAGHEKVIKVIRSALEFAANAQGWQPIETARKDDVILGYEPGGGMAVVSWMNNKWRDHHGSGLCPEFWMHLPAAPMTDAEGKDE